MPEQPKKAAESKIGRSQEALKWIIEADGLTATLERIKSICGQKAIVLIELNTLERYNAPKWLQAADALESAIDEIKYHIKLDK